MWKVTESSNSLNCRDSFKLPLYLVQVTGNGVAESNLSEQNGPVILSVERYFRGLFIKVARSRNISMRQLEILSINIYLYPNENYDT